jgi:glycosyltransferase involved in cell wall biosynthesis
MSQQTPLKVSVAMPAYNAERYLGEAIESILGQTFTDFEFLIVDDGSTDRTLAILRDYEKRDSRIRVISRPNTGIVGALNDMLAVAQGELIARMDADDIALPERFDRQVKYMDEHPDCVLVGSRVLLIDPDGDPLKVMETPLDHESLVDGFLNFGGQLIHHPATMMRRQTVIDLGGYRPELRGVEDLDLFLRLSEVGQIVNLAEPLLKYREHESKASVVKREMYARDIEQSVQAARRRRGMEPAATESIRNLEFSNDPAHFHRTWGWFALMSGHVGVARKHARASLARGPFSLASWKLAYCAVRGH